LADTVDAIDKNDCGTGIVFEDASISDLRAALCEALALYDASSHYKSVQINAMAVESSWDNPASDYLDLYKHVAKKTFT
jgi:starch synthase